MKQHIGMFYECSVLYSNDKVADFFIKNNLFNPNLISFQVLIDAISTENTSMIQRLLNDGYCINRLRLARINMDFDPKWIFVKQLAEEVKKQTPTIRALKMNALSKKANEAIKPNNNIITKKQKKSFIDYCVSIFIGHKDYGFIYRFSDDLKSATQQLLTDAMAGFIDMYIDIRKKNDELSHDDFHDFINFIFIFCVNQSEM